MLIIALTVIVIIKMIFWIADFHPLKILFNTDKKKEWMEWTNDIKNGINSCYGYPYSKVAKMVWDTIKKIYAVNPLRFKIVISARGDTKCLVYNANQQSTFSTSFGKQMAVDPATVWNQSTNVAILLSYPDYKAFLKAEVEYKNNEKKKKELQDMRFVIESVQKDIERLKSQANQEVNQANQMMQEIIARGSV